MVAVGLFALTSILSTGRRALAGPERTASWASHLATVGAVAVAGVVLVFVCNLNRGVLTPVQGVPWVIPVARRGGGRPVFMFGREPGSAATCTPSAPAPKPPVEPASMWHGSGPSPSRFCSFVAGLAVVVYASRLGSLSVGFDGGTYVLYAVAAAVIGGASLFGGHGKPIHPVLGGLVIATLTNGLALLNISTAGTDIATAAVLLVAVAVDSTLRRRGRSSEA